MRLSNYISHIILCNADDYDDDLSLYRIERERESCISYIIKVVIKVNSNFELNKTKQNKNKKKISKTKNQKKQTNKHKNIHGVYMRIWWDYICLYEEGINSTRGL